MHAPDAAIANRVASVTVHTTTRLAASLFESISRSPVYLRCGGSFTIRSYGFQANPRPPLSPSEFSSQHQSQFLDYARANGVAVDKFLLKLELAATSTVAASSELF